MLILGFTIAKITSNIDNSLSLAATYASVCSECQMDRKEVFLS